MFVDELDEVPDGASVVFSAHGVSPAVRAEATGAGSGDRRDLPAGVQGARRGPAVRRRRLHGRADRPRRPRGGRGHARRGAGLDGAGPDRAGRRRAAAGGRRAGRLHDRRPRCRSTRRRGYRARCGSGSRAIAARAATTSATRHQPAGRGAGGRAGIRPGARGGSRNSSNSLRLVETCERAGATAHLIDSAADIELGWLTGVSTIGLTAGASAPPAVVEEIISALSGLGPLSVSERVTTTESIRFGLPKEVRQ